MTHLTYYFILTCVQKIQANEEDEFSDKNFMIFFLFTRFIDHTQQFTN